MTNLARDCGLNSGAVGLSVVFEVVVLGRLIELPFICPGSTCNLSAFISRRAQRAPYNIVAKGLYHDPIFIPLLQLYQHCISSQRKVLSNPLLSGRDGFELLEESISHEVDGRENFA